MIFSQLPGQKMAFHCAPVIAGVKPANIIMLKKPVPQDMREYLEAVAPGLARKGVYLHTLAECPQHVLLMVYSRAMLARHLAEEGSRTLLRRFGYPEGAVLQALLERLCSRFDASGAFPHEVGVFLGYPPCDVDGFIRNKGRDYRFCGYWKVYGNVAKAKETFSVYDNVKLYFSQRVADGEEIYNITYGGTAV